MNWWDQAKTTNAVKQAKFENGIDSHIMTRKYDLEILKQIWLKQDALLNCWSNGGIYWL